MFEISISWDYKFEFSDIDDVVNFVGLMVENSTGEELSIKVRNTSAPTTKAAPPEKE